MSEDIMKLTCPICQSRYSLEEVATTSALREMIGLAAKFGRTWSLVEEYVAAFRTSQYGGITLKKRFRLFREMAGLWDGGEFVYNGKRYRTDRAQIREALITVCNADKFGFKNHNYLKKILMDGADRVSTEGMTAQEERIMEADRRAEAESRGNGESEKEDAPMSTAEFKKNLAELADQIGGMS